MPSKTKFGSTSAGTSWSSLGNLYADDSAFATFSVAKSSTSKLLTINGFGFGLPTGSAIGGITAVIDRKSSSTSSLSLGTNGNIGLYKSTTLFGTAKKSSTTWGTSEATETFGGTTDKWGNSTITSSDVNGSTFGVGILIYNSSNSSSRTASVDYIKLTVQYELNINTFNGMNFAISSRTVKTVNGVAVASIGGGPIA